MGPRGIGGRAQGAGGGPADGYGGYRAQLVETLRDKGIRDLGVLHTIATVPRHRFVPEALRHRAYEDVPLPIGAGQTISQPYVHARTLELLRLKGSDRVLEVGAGSGYQTALLAAQAGTVLAVERVAELAKAASDVIAKVQAVIPDRLRDYMANTALLAPPHHYMEPVSFDVAELRRALRNQLKVRFNYRDAQAEQSERVVRPLCLAYYGPVWMLSAWCDLRDDFRTFRLDRIADFVVSSDRFRHEPGKTLHDFLKRDQTWTRSRAAPNGKADHAPNGKCERDVPNGRGDGADTARG